MKKLTAKAYQVLISAPLIFILIWYWGGSAFWLSLAALLWVFTVFFIFQARHCDATEKSKWVALSVMMIPISTVVLGNAMVPIFFIGHASMHGAGAHEIHGVSITDKHVMTRLDILTQVQRPLYVSAYVDRAQLQLRPGQEEKVRFFVVNQQDKRVRIVFKQVGVPANAEHYITISQLPKELDLAPGEGADIELSVKMKSAVPKLFNHAIMQLLLMDKSIVGALGKQTYWKKMKMPAEKMLKRMQND